MSQESSGMEEMAKVDLRDPALAAFLAWLVPGLGHWYQGRKAKSILFFVCIMGTFCYGLYLGGSPEVGWGRSVYVSWRPGDRRFQYICQIGVGLPALPAVVQANRVRDGKEPLCGGMMAPPRLDSSDPNQLDPPTVSALHRHLNRYYEFGTLFTVIAGLLNILAIYDAWGGPVFGEESRGKDEDEDKEEDS